MAILKLRQTASPPATFTFDKSLSPSSSPVDVSSLATSPTSWLPASDMKIFSAHPMSSTSDIGLVKCLDCDRPVLRSCIVEHSGHCAASSGRPDAMSPDGEDPKRTNKKRKASPSPADPSQPPKKKNKGALAAAPNSKVTKGRIKGPINLDRNCGVINDKGLPCSRSLTCKSHAMGAKRAVEGRSRKYDDLLLDWQRENNPNFVEPVRRESKAEKKEKKEKEKQEKRRLAEEQAAALGIDLTKRGALGSLKKHTTKKPSTPTTGHRTVDTQKHEYEENLDDLDSEAEVDDLVRVIRDARERGVIAQPLAVPCDAGSWFVASRERARGCRDLLAGAFPSVVSSISTGNFGNGQRTPAMSFVAMPNRLA